MALVSKALCPLQILALLTVKVGLAFTVTVVVVEFVQMPFAPISV